MPKLIKAYKNDFTIIDNQIFKDKRLGCKDLGLLCLMFSLPDDWEFSISGLSTVCKDGKDSIRTWIETLERYGYLTRKQARKERGSFDGYDYYLYMNPKDNDDFPPKEDVPTSDTPLTENPTTGEPTTGEPSLDYPSQENKQEERIKKILLLTTTTTKRFIKINPNQQRERMTVKALLMKRRLIRFLTCKELPKPVQTRSCV